MLNSSLSCLYFQLVLVAILLPFIFPLPELTGENSVNFTEGVSDESTETDLLKTITDSNTNNTANSNATKNSSVFRAFGTLHTLNSLADAAAKEEKIYRVLKRRRESLLQKAKLITRLFTACKKTLIKTFLETKAKLNGPWKLENLLKENSISFSHMANGFFKFVNQLRKERRSKYYKDLWESLSTVLELLNDHNETDRRWPNSEDLYISHNAIVDIQDIYDIESGQIFQGLNYNTNFGGFLKAFHCAVLGTVALKKGQHIRSVEWLEFTVAFIRQEFNGRDYTIAEDFVKGLLMIAIQEHNSKFLVYKKTMQTSEDSMYLFSGPVHLDQSWSARWHIRKPVLKQYGMMYGNESYGFLNMYTICMGDDLQPESVKSHLFCYLDKDRHPYFLLNPLKTEQLSKYPYIVQMYDVLGNDTIEEMYKKRREPRLSTVVGVDNIEDSLGIRSSAGSLTEIDFMYKMQNRSELISGLLLTDMLERIQTVEYTYGRLYKFHNDPGSTPLLPVDIEGDKELKIYGDRVATILYYGDVSPDGGETAFNQVGITARPVRGSAVFWINMFRNGSVRPDVTHTACPVIHGHKTIINQWIRYNSNFLTFKCSLNQFD